MHNLLFRYTSRKVGAHSYIFTKVDSLTAHNEHDSESEKN
jgi:hypothetical protein